MMVQRKKESFEIQKGYNRTMHVGVYMCVCIMHCMTCTSVSEFSSLAGGYSGSLP